MMDGEDVYRARIAACLKAADTEPLSQMRGRHLAAAQSWQALLDAEIERKRSALAERAPER
jgi:hypothetical protein